jgi:hypothetical protein
MGSFTETFTDLLSSLRAAPPAASKAIANPSRVVVTVNGWLVLTVIALAAPMAWLN